MTKLVEPTESTDLINIVIPLSPPKFAELSADLDVLAKKLNLPDWASNTELIVEAVHRQAASG